MIRVSVVSIGAILLVALWVSGEGKEEGEKRMGRKLQVIIFTGGHDFDRDEFFAVFNDSPDIHWIEARQPEANETWVGDKLKDYDAIVFYDLWQKITGEQKRGMVRWLKEEGKGLVALHHSIANYQGWDEYPRIIGARYFLSPGKAPDGTEYPRSRPHFNVHYTVRVLDKDHPVTKGLPETFKVIDETYKGFWIAPNVQKLLGTDHEKSEPFVAWAHRYGKARIVYIQLGHGPTVYRNPYFRKLVHNALRWVAQAQ